MTRMWGQLRRAKRDACHMPIARALVAHGCSVLDLSSVGGGCPDIFVGWAGRYGLLMELKSERTDKGGGAHPVTANQMEFHREWRGTPVVVVRDIDEALAAMRAAEADPTQARVGQMEHGANSVSVSQDTNIAANPLERGDNR